MDTFDSGTGTSLPKIRKVRKGDKRRDATKSLKASRPWRHLDLGMDDKNMVRNPRMAFPRLDMQSAPEETANQMGNIWMLGLIDHEMQTEDRRARQRDGLLKEYRMADIVRPSSAESKRSEITPRPFDKKLHEMHLSEKEWRRFAQLSKKYSDEATVKRELKKAKSKHYHKSLAGAVSVYTNENKKVREALSLARSGKRKATHRTKMVSSYLDSVIRYERRHAEAALVIQTAFKNYKRKVWWKEFVLKSRSAKKIQALVRGVLTRHFVRLWLKREWYLVTQVQAAFRAVVSRRGTKLKANWEHPAALDIQRVFRGFRGRKRVWLLRASRAAIMIQALWRGVVVRADMDKEWLDRKLIVVQAQVKRWLAQRKYVQESKRCNKAALEIQRVFRGTRARARRDEMLWDRETESRELYMQLLRGEEKAVEKKLRKQKRKLKRAKHAEKVKALRQQWYDEIEAVRAVEFDTTGLMRERARVSPRAVEQGWVEELDKNLEEHRMMVTEAKMKALFKHAKPLRQAEAVQHRDELEMDNLEYRAAQIAEWWIQDRNEMVKRDAVRSWARHYLERRRSVAAQRRKWRYKYVTESGKPDVLRPDGKAWDPNNFPHSDSHTMNAGAATLRMLGPDGHMPIPGFAGEPAPASAETLLEELLAEAHSDGEGSDEERVNPYAPHEDDTRGDATPRTVFTARSRRSSLASQRSSRPGTAASSRRGSVAAGRGAGAAAPKLGISGVQSASRAIKSAARSAGVVEGDEPKKTRGTVEEDFRKKALQELRANMQAGNRMKRVIAQVETTSANMQLVQYGALLKPLLESMQEMVETLHGKDAKRKAAQAAMEVDADEIPDITMEKPQEDKIDKSLSREEKLALKREAAVKAREEQKSKVAGFDISEVEGDEPVEAVPITPTKRPGDKKKKAWKYRQSRIPWYLLDELEAEKYALQQAKKKPLPFPKRFAPEDKLRMEEVDPNEFKWGI